MRARRETVSRTMGVLRKLRPEELERRQEELAQVATQLQRSNSCEACGSSAPHSPESAAAAIRRHADAGRGWAQYMLGDKYQSGVGVDQSLEMGYSWLVKAAAQKRPHPNAAYALGRCRRGGIGVRADAAAALAWLRPIAEAGHAGAMHQMGQIYQHGWGVNPSAEGAVSWWLRGAEEGSRECQSDLGCCYERGAGVPREEAQARRWFAAAAEQGDPKAQFNLGGMLYRDGSADAVRQAIELCRKAAAQDDQDAIRMLKELGIS